MKIIYIDVNYKNSSTGDIVYNLHSSCLNSGIESYVCYGRGPLIKDKNVFKFGLDFETAIHALLTRITGYTGCFSFFSTRRLIKRIKAIRPDIVHIHELHAYFVNIKPLLKYLRKENIPTVFTNHCEFLYTGKCGYGKECNRYSMSCGKCPHLKEYPKSMLFDHTKYMLNVKRALFDGWNNCYIVSPSKWLDSRINDSFLKNKPRFIIHNGINTDLYNLINHEKDKQFTILSIAPNIFSIVKGGYEVLKIAKLMDKSKYRFVLVGADNLIESSQSNITIMNRIYDKNEIVKLYNSADVFLMCSRNENFPTTSLEAQCCGLPVIAYDAGGTKETILEGNGVVVKVNDAEAAVNEIEKLYNSKVDHEKISNVSRTEYGYNKMFENYLELYNKIIIGK